MKLPDETIVYPGHGLSTRIKDEKPIYLELRPKKYHNKTLWIERDMKDFYSFKNYYKEFNETFQNDCEKQRHNKLLYLIWAEKIYFLKEVVDNNVFNTKCFYWIDIGYFC